MNIQLNPKLIEEALSDKYWDFGNQILYDLCAANPDHNEDSVVIAKIWLIGRSYSAAIERRQDAASDGDRFYENTVAPAIRKSDIDSWFRDLAQDRSKSVARSVETHKRLMDLFESISGLDKRSLASKYLHFHFPERVYIFDSRANDAIRKLTKPVGRSLPPVGFHDDLYARFCFRCHTLNDQIRALVGRFLTPRELDKVLLRFHQTED